MWRVTPPSCKRDEIKRRDNMDRRVTPPNRVTSPTSDPPPPCKQALSRQYNNFARASHFFVHFFAVFARPRRGIA